MNTLKQLSALIFSTTLFTLLPLQTATSADPPPDQSLVAQVKTLQEQVNTLQLQLSSLIEISQYVSLESINNQPTVRFTGINIQVVNGEGMTASANGTGNLIIGYDEPHPATRYRCTLGTDPSTSEFIDNESACLSAGGEWLYSFKSGSHYLVLGTQNNYSRWGGIVAGQQNVSTYDFSSVLGGYRNIASGKWSSVSGGVFGTASGITSTVGGGSRNTAGGHQSNVSGGNNNTATGQLSSINGGQYNTANGQASNISGGSNNTANGYASSVLGGVSESANDDWQTIPSLP